MSTKSILVLGGADLNVAWGRCQSLISALARHHRIFYVENPVKLSQLLTGRRRLRPARTDLSAGPHQHVRPIEWLSAFGRPELEKVQDWLIVRRVNAALGAAGFVPDVIWCYGLRSERLLPYFHAPLRVYDCADDQMSPPRKISPREREEIRLREERLLRGVDIAIAVSERLLAHVSRVAERSVLIPNGVDHERFARALSLGDGLPEDLRAIPAPRIGFIGYIQEWVDQELLVECARRLRQVSFVVVGPANVDVRRLVAEQNIYLIGYRPYSDLYRYLAGFDVALVPYLQSDRIDRCDSVKIYQYLAAGCPVVSTRFPSASRLGEAIMIADDRSDFVDKIEAALERVASHSREEISRRAADESWEARAEAVEKVVFQDERATDKVPSGSVGGGRGSDFQNEHDVLKARPC